LQCCNATQNKQPNKAAEQSASVKLIGRKEGKVAVCTTEQLESEAITKRTVDSKITREGRAPRKWEVEKRDWMRTRWGEITAGVWSRVSRSLEVEDGDFGSCCVVLGEGAGVLLLNVKLSGWLTLAKFLLGTKLSRRSPKKNNLVGEGTTPGARHPPVNRMTDNK
jgi:hypothetical protein